MFKGTRDVTVSTLETLSKHQAKHLTKALGHMQALLWKIAIIVNFFFFFSSRRRHTRFDDWSSDVCSSDLLRPSTDLTVGLYASGDGAVTAGVYLPSLPPTINAVVAADSSNGSQAPVKYHAASEQARALEIGRASCRERV